MPCAIWRASGKSGIWALSFLWRPGFSCCCLAGLLGSCNFMPGAASVMRRASASASRRIPTIPMARHRGQTPPSFSAKKVKGRPAYELARKKQTVELKAVEVEIYEYKLKEIEGSFARFGIECSSGTYIRALAHEMGEKLGCGAHLAEITRTAVGEFSLEQAIT